MSAVRSARPIRQRLLAFATVMLALFFIMEVFAPVARADTYSLDLPLLVLHGDPGTQVVIYDGPMPVSGQNCEVTVTNAANNTSVHIGNNLTLESDGQSVNFLDVERAANVETPGDQSIVPGANGTLTLTFGEDHQFSAHISLEFDCAPLATTTTIAQTTTTTVGDSTTTTPGDTTTTIGETSTTIDGTSTTIAETSTTVAGETTTVPDEVLDTEVLPFTGAETGKLAILGLSLLALGSLLVFKGDDAEES